MTHIGVVEAKARLSELLRRAAAGEEIVITRRGEEIAHLVALERQRLRVFGEDRGAFEVSDDFDGPLPETVSAGFEDA